jgi:hypothetical protein
MAETEAIEEQFAGIDAVIARAEAEAATLPSEPGDTAPELTEQERRDVEAALNLVYGEDRSTARPGHAA